ncbi:MAG: lyase family protein [Armatimonadota bacterium]
MPDRSLFDNVSPLDFRYYGQDEALQNLLDPFVTERGRVMSEAMVEAAATRVLARRGICSEAVADEVAEAAANIDPLAVAAEEQRIQHNIRALVNCLQGAVSEQARPYVHFTLTSFDVVDSATAWRLKNAGLQVVVPELLKLEKTLIDLARREKDTLQMGRTHGQHAVPITFGFAIAEYVSRLGGRIEAIRAAAEDMRGKISGAVGAYNASSLFFADPVSFETEVLAEIGLKPSLHSTQVVEAEFVADYVHALTAAFGVLANLADDMRHLQRTEIGEVGEAFAADQVGSSTMPHKRNPWNFENVKSMWKEFMPRMMTVYMDQLSEHQRDLTNSASARFIPETIVGLVSSVRRMNRIMSKMVTDQDRMLRNFLMTANMIAAEPAYILLAAHGHPDAHEAVRKVTLEAQRTDQQFQAVLFSSAELKPYLDTFSKDQLATLFHPTSYTGYASQKTEALCEYWEKQLGL